MGSFGISYLDHSQEKSIAKIRTVDLTAANFDAQAVLHDAFFDAVEAAVLGTPARVTTVASDAILAGVGAPPFAQRENKWLVRSQDNDNGRASNFEIPCPDLDLLEAGTDRMDTSSAEYIALVAAIEAVALTIDENNLTVIEIIYVGRNI